MSIKKPYYILFSCLLCLSLVIPTATAGAEATYKITETELNQLQTNLEKLEQLSQTQKTESTRLREQLVKSKQDLQTLREQLNTSEQRLTQAQNSLETANALLKTYGEEEKRTRRRIKAQKNTWAAVAGILLTVIIAKNG